MSTKATSWEEALEEIAKAKTPEEIDQLEIKLLGRKQGLLTESLKALGKLPPEERRMKGQELNAWKQKITEALEAARAQMGEASLQKLAKDDPLDVTMDLPQKRKSGHLHLIPEFIRNVEDVFGRMGFDVAYGPEVEEEELNFTLVNIPYDHPARDMQDTFWIEGDNRHVLRTQTTPVQIRYMREHEPPFRMICPGKTYRKDADATHSPMFHQFEGLMVDRTISIANMKAVMIGALTTLVGENIDVRFRTGYFPFVEPGLEADMRWHTSEGPGPWIEVVGCGMVHPQVLRNGGVDPKQWSGFAFGFGVERLLMIKHHIKDLRTFFENDLRFLRQF